MDEKIAQFKDIISQAKRIVFFGGAGVSTESNIPDFRSEDGLYHTKYKYPPEVILSHTFFMEHTEDFFKFYRDKMVYRDAVPNATHIALSKLEKEGRLTAVITQNIDGLHQAAGSRHVLELHGSIYRNYCTRCGQSYDLDFVMRQSGVPRCSCGGVVKPDVVLYEESLNQRILAESIQHISRADVLIVGGTSLAVYPAAGLIDYYSGDKLILINRDKTPYDDKANLVIHDSLGKVFSGITD